MKRCHFKRGSQRCTGVDGHPGRCQFKPLALPKLKGGMSWIKPSEKKKVEELTEKIQNLENQKFYNDMKDMGWDATVNGKVNAELTGLLLHEVLPLLRKVTCLPPVKKER